VNLKLGRAQFPWELVQYESLSAIHLHIKRLAPHMKYIDLRYVHDLIRVRETIHER
jgi:hypothetical protein